MHFSQCGEKVLINTCAGSNYNFNGDKDIIKVALYLCCAPFEARVRAFANLAEGKINLIKEVASCLILPSSKT